MASFEGLPMEIILHIHLLSTSSSLPIVSRYLQTCINSSATSSYRARWLLLRLSREGYAPSAPHYMSPSSRRVHAKNAHNGGGNTSSINSTRMKNIRRRRAVMGIASVHEEDEDACFLNKALKYPICDLDTLKLLENKCRDNLDARLQAHHSERVISILKRNSHNPHNSNGVHHVEEKQLPPPPPYPTFLPLPPRSIDIPKRLFRNLQATSPPSNSFINSNTFSSPTFQPSTIPATFPTDTCQTNTVSPPTIFEEQDLPLLLHLLNTLQANPNSSRGYPLAKAVLARNIPLIQVLLSKGADPAVKDYMAVMLAVGRNDVEIVKLLVEVHECTRDVIPSLYMPGLPESVVKHNQRQAEDIALANDNNTAVITSSASVVPHGKKRKRTTNEMKETRSLPTSASPKKRKLEDRIQITSEMLELAVKQGCEPLIQFFMSKGAVPSLKTLQMLQG